MVISLNSNYTMTLSAFGTKSDSVINATVFEMLFRTHYASLVVYARRFLNDTDAARDVVQSVFIRVWERRVSLSGEAWFEVAPDSKHPFIVGSGEFEVRVVGTQFNVRNVEGAETFNVEVLEGIVDLVRLTGTDSPLRLKAGDGAVFYHRTKTLDRVRFSMNNIAWKSGRISFDDSPLLDVFATLERVYETRLVANDASILQERLVGTFAYDDFDHIIDVICRTFNLRYEGDSAMIMVYRNN